MSQPTIVVRDQYHTIVDAPPSSTGLADIGGDAGSHRAMPAPSDPPASQHAPDVDEFAALSPEEREGRRIARREAFASRIDEHYGAPRDAVWSGAMTDRVQGLLIEGAQQVGQGTTLIDVDCRQSSCAALLEWPDFEAAEHSWQALLHRSGVRGCEREILLDETDDPSRRFQATLLFRCDRALSDAP